MHAWNQVLNIATPYTYKGDTCQSCPMIVGSEPEWVWCFTGMHTNARPLCKRVIKWTFLSKESDFVMKENGFYLFPSVWGHKKQSLKALFAKK